MAADSENDDGRPGSPDGPDPHGHAALLLVESLIHGLIARGTLSVAEAVEIVDVATDVKVDGSAEIGDASANGGLSVSLLEAIGASLGRDLPDD